MRTLTTQLHTDNNVYKFYPYRWQGLPQVSVCQHLFEYYNMGPFYGYEYMVMKCFLWYFHIDLSIPAWSRLKLYMDHLNAVCMAERCTYDMTKKLERYLYPHRVQDLNLQFH